MLKSDANERIRGAFLSLLSEKSYKKMTFKEVAGVTGMSRQNLYFYYESKESVLKDVIEEFFDRLYQKMVCLKQNSADYLDHAAFSEALIREMGNALMEDSAIARSFFSSDVEKLFVDKHVIFTKRLLGGIVREQGIIVKDPQYIHYLALQMTGAAYFPVKEWVLNDMDFSIDKLVVMLHPIFDQAIPMLKKN